ncbi:MAG: ATP-binding protein [Opitutaceae bacterium]|jgi:hypothetical protein
MNESNMPLRAVVQRLNTTGLFDDQTVINGSLAVSHRSSPARDELILARYAVGDDRQFYRSNQTHGELRLMRETISVGGIRRRLAEAAESVSFEVGDGLKIEVGENSSIELLPSDDPQTGICARYEIRLSARHRGYLSQAGPLVAYGLPSFESPEQAVRAWIGLRPFHGSSDARLGNILLEVPLAAPRLGTLALESEQMMRITIVGLPSETPVEVTGVWQSGDAASIEQFAHKVLGDVVEIPRPHWAVQVAIWLVRADSLITDFYFESANRCSRSRRILYPPIPEANSRDPEVLAQILSGEGEGLEFKPFLKPGSDKFSELIKTIIGFSNKRGGSIYLGVSDHQEIEGVEKELWDAGAKDGGNTLEERTRWYCALVRKLIRDRVSKGIDFRVESCRVGGKLLLVVSVEEGKEKPCSDVITNDVWTRRGANTVRASVDEIKQMIASAVPVRGFFDWVRPTG